MTTPQVPSFDFSTVIPKKYKPLVGFLGAIMTFIGPALAQWSLGLSPVWQTVIALFFAALAALGIYQSPFVPKDSVLVKKDELKQAVETVVAHDGDVEVVLPPEPGIEAPEVIPPVTGTSNPYGGNVSIDNPYPAVWPRPKDQA